MKTRDLAIVRPASFVLDAHEGERPTSAAKMSEAKVREEIADVVQQALMVYKQRAGHVSRVHRSGTNCVQVQFTNGCVLNVVTGKFPR